MASGKRPGSGSLGEQYIDKYRIDDRLGSGTFATVFRCYDPDLDTVCAIKVLAENWSEDENARKWFLNEARIMFGIEHPSILRIFTSGTLEDGRPYFAMEFADEGSLADLIRERRQRKETFATAEALDISIAIADGLNVAHTRGLVHRDLKPSNILFRSSSSDVQAEADTPSAKRQIKLADFGLARRLEHGANSLAGAGTPHYIAPEQARGLADERPDVRNDIYSAATILYEMLAGQVPFAYSSMTQVIAAHIEEEPTPIRKHAPHVPEEVAAAIHSGLAKNPEHRTPSALSWRHQLQVLRAALNPDGTISGWQSGTRHQSEQLPGPAVPFVGPAFHQPAAPEPVGIPTVPDVEELASTRIKRNDGVSTVGEIADHGDRNPQAERSDRMMPFVAAVIVAGLVVVGLLGYALANLISEHESTLSSDQDVPVEVVGEDDSDDEGESLVEAASNVSPTQEPTEEAVEPAPSPEPQPEPTATPESTAEPDADPATEYIAGTLQQLPGSASSAVVLPSGELVGDASDREVAAASTIKLWIAAAAFDSADSGDLDLGESYTVTAEDQAFGTGILNGEQYLRQSFTLDELIEVMLVYSDNSAANILVEHLGGFDVVNEYAQQNDYQDTRMQRSLGNLDPERENYTSARDGALFMERLIGGDIVSEEASSRLQEILERRAETEGGGAHFFGQNLPSGVQYAHISGLLPGVRNEIGYFYNEDRGGFAVVSFMLGELSDESAGETAISNVVGDINAQLSEVAMR
jgi:serine/threonine protein kinase